MKKVVCIKDNSFLIANGFIKNNVYTLVEETELFWSLQYGNRLFDVSKAFDEFMDLKEYRKLKLEKIYENR